MVPPWTCHGTIERFATPRNMARRRHWSSSCPHGTSTHLIHKTVVNAKTPGGINHGWTRIDSDSATIPVTLGRVASEGGIWMKSERIGLCRRNASGGARVPAGPLAGLCPALAGFRPFGFQYEKPLAKGRATRFTRLVSALGSAIASTACPYQRLAQGGHQPGQRHRLSARWLGCAVHLHQTRAPNYQPSTLNPVNQRVCLHNPMKIRLLTEVNRVRCRARSVG